MVYGKHNPVFHLGFFIAFLSLLNIFSVSAQVDSLSNSEKLIKVKQTSAAVELDGKILFYVRGITSFSAEERSQMVSERILLLAEDESFNTDSLKVIHETDHNVIFGGANYIVKLFDVDAEIEGISRDVLAEMVKQNIAKAISSYRYERSSEVLIKRIIIAGVSTILFIVLLFLINAAANRLNTYLESKLKARIEGIEAKAFKLIQAKQLWIGIQGLTKVVKLIVLILLVIGYLNFVLGTFPLTKPIAGKIFSFVIEPLGVMANSTLDSLPNIAFLAVLFFVVRYLLKLVNLFFRGISQGTIVLPNFDSDWSLPTYKIVRFLVIVFAIVIAYPYIPGSDSDAFKGVSVLLGIMFSIGSSSVISNVIAGYSLTYRRAFKLGDIIKIGDDLGEVIDVKPFVTRVRSFKNEEVIIPNSGLVNSQVINFSSLAKKNGLILHTTVGIGYETPWRLVEEILTTAADRTEGLLKEPRPFVLQKSLGDFAVVYEINAFCNEPSRMMKIYTGLHQNIIDIFNENNIQIMTPAYEGDPAEPKIVSIDKWHTPLRVDGKS